MHLAFRDFRDVYFNHLRPSAVDVSRTPDVTIAQGEFHNASFGSLKFDGGCENIVIKVRKHVSTISKTIILSILIEYQTSRRCNITTYHSLCYQDSLLPKSSLMLLNSNRTSVSFSCTASPDRLATDLLKMMSQVGSSRTSVYQSIISADIHMEWLHL